MDITIRAELPSMEASGTVVMVQNFAWQHLQAAWLFRSQLMLAAPTSGPRDISWASATYAGCWREIAAITRGIRVVRSLLRTGLRCCQWRVGSLMKVGIIGGAERNELQYRRVAQELGHELEFHSGKLSSCGSSSLETLVRRCDLVVIATDTNSHAAVRTARSLMRSRGKSPLLIRKLGISRLTELLSEGALTAVP